MKKSEIIMNKEERLNIVRREVTDNITLGVTLLSDILVKVMDAHKGELLKFEDFALIVDEARKMAIELNEGKKYEEV